MDEKEEEREERVCVERAHEEFLRRDTIYFRTCCLHAVSDSVPPHSSLVAQISTNTTKDMAERAWRSPFQTHEDKSCSYCVTPAAFLSFPALDPEARPESPRIVPRRDRANAS